MKKIIAAAAGLAMVAGTASSVLALENEFGGYWRTRMFSQIDFQDDDGTYSVVDTRTRLYYTAKFTEGFKLVNKFEMDAVWGGDSSSYGDVGADGKSFEIKNSYADIDAFGANFKLGVQGVRVARGLLIDTDASALIATFNAGDIVLPFVWMRVTEEEVIGEERDHYAVLPVIQAGEGVTVQPMFIYDVQEGSDWNNFYAGVNVDMKTDAFSAWGTGVYEFGEINDQDVSAFLLAAGASAGPVHGQAFYATGDDDPADGDIDAFVNPAGRSYYWAEILGYGTFDPGRARGPKDGISNVWAANVGFKVKPADKLTVGADVWYASLAEDNAAGDSDLGLEFDVKATYAVYENLAVDLVAAYLIAGDAYGDEDPIEFGARVSLAF